MKKIFTLVAAVLITVVLNAAGAPPRGMLIVKSVDKADIQVILDGKMYDPGFNSVMIDGLRSGVHTIEILKERSAAAVAEGKAEYRSVYNTNITIKRRTKLFITIEKNGAISLQENRIGNSGSALVEGQADNLAQDQGGIGSYDSHAAYAVGMQASDFSQIMVAINRESLEVNKLKSASQIVKNNSLSTQQVRQLMQFFCDESNRLSLAKVAYVTVVDKDNFSELADLFRETRSQQDFACFVRDQAK